MSRRLLVMLLVAVASVAAAPETVGDIPYRGQELLDDCQENLDYYATPREKWKGDTCVHCVMYLRGVAEAGDVLGTDRFCVPRDVSNNELASAIVRELHAHKELLALPMPDAAVGAFAAAWPCHK